jgi:hypothetical protein
MISQHVVIIDKLTNHNLHFKRPLNTDGVIRVSLNQTALLVNFGLQMKP